MSKMHTLAFQIDDDMYVAIKGYLDQYKLITNQKISQRSFILKRNRSTTAVKQKQSWSQTRLQQTSNFLFANVRQLVRPRKQII